MSLLSSLYVGTSGLEASSQELTVVGDNIANANTVGYKRGRAAFEESLSHSLIGSSGQVGMGTRMYAVQRIFDQGALLNTGVGTDLALQGSGMFIVRGAYGGVQGTYFSRAGQFAVDANGYLSNLQGLQVQGYLADPLGNVTGTVGDIRVSNATEPPLATSSIVVRANLQSDAPILTTVWDPTTPSSNFMSSVTIYDSLGQSHQVDIHYRRIADGQWEWHAVTDGAGVQGGTAGVPSEIAQGTLDYDTQGRLVNMTEASNFLPLNALAPQALTFNFGTSLTAGGTGMDGITQYAATSATSFINQNGAASGDLAHVDIDMQGNVVGTFSNGRTRVLARLAIADFEAPDQLRSVGGNLWSEMLAAGQPTIGVPGEAGRGSVLSGALEQSNVDIAAEFVRMIAAQRGFQANSKTISTADQLLNELIALKR